MDKNLEILNHILVDTFNEILKVEERSLRLVAGSKVTVNEVHTLDAIGDGDLHTVTELAGAMMVTVSTMTIAVNRLEKKGLVERERAGHDRRVVRVRLTDRGRSLVYVHKRFHRRMVKAVAERLDPNEIEILSRAMENLRDFFHSENLRNAKGIVASDKLD
ncbi:MAG: MarR family transcriptional regulator [Clostridiales bacterium]|jgi:DNA-binding MarR family transcriptional regulator|nr:MarR family transcriptional regulator [Clostridiales bacterium]